MATRQFFHPTTRPTLYEIQSFPIDIVETKSNGTNSQRRMSLQYVIDYINDWIRFEPAAGIRIQNSPKSFSFINEVGGTKLLVTCGSRNQYIVDMFVFLIQNGTPEEFPVAELDWDEYLSETYPWEDTQDFKQDIFQRYPHLK